MGWNDIANVLKKRNEEKVGEEDAQSAHNAQLDEYVKQNDKEAWQDSYLSAEKAEARRQEARQKILQKLAERNAAIARDPAGAY